MRGQTWDQEPSLVYLCWTWRLYSFGWGWYARVQLSFVKRYLCTFHNHTVVCSVHTLEANLKDKCKMEYQVKSFPGQTHGRGHQPGRQTQIRRPAHAPQVHVNTLNGCRVQKNRKIEKVRKISTCRCFNGGFYSTVSIHEMINSILQHSLEEVPRKPGEQLSYTLRCTGGL